MIYDATQCQLGEGPLWHPERAELFWFDILGKRLHCRGSHWQFDDFVSAAGWVDDSSLLVATDNAIRHLDLTTGDHRVIVDLEPDNRVTRSNDGRADPQGGFWIGTMGIEAEKEAGAIYRYYRGTLRRLFGNLTIPNSICFAPDGRTAYFCDTPTQMIMQVALDNEGWPIGDPSVHIDLRGTEYHPDGAVVDADGNLWNAQWGASRVAAYGPDGRLIESFSFAAQQTTCPAFGGADYRTLFCTSAAVGLAGEAEGKTYSTTTRYTGQREHRVVL